MTRSRRLKDNPHFIIYSEAFLDVLGPDPGYETLPNVNAHEGPVYVRHENALYFTTVPVTTNIPAFGDKNVAIGRLDVASGEVSTFVAEANMANGMTLDREGRLLICEQGSLETDARISRMNLKTKKVETVVDHWFGLPFNSPNDIVEKSDGTIWFTDPAYGSLQGFRPKPLIGDFVYRYAPADDSVTVVVDTFKKPNGLCFSPDESILYVNDSGAIEGPNTYYVDLPHHIRVFDVADNSHLVNERLFAVVTPIIPDGLKVDSQGRVYSSSGTGVQVFDATGRILGEILAGGVANFCFGGIGNNMLFMMCDTAINIATLAATGV
ncbi:MAG TPA: SMP-30/gluconolactonase/LRE family protein [Thermoanaerobaculia bacterium]|jgi:gluconolactonase|nr:SMP-30/gluconolactonase/LRE family protein [Thermoanaerobaculia bacterium]